MHLDFKSQLEAREAVIHHTTLHLIDMETALRRAKSGYYLKRQALKRLEVECKTLRCAYINGTLATLYFRQALDLQWESINSTNNTLLIPVQDQSVCRYHSSKCTILNWFRLLTSTTKDYPLISALSLCNGSGT